MTGRPPTKTRRSGDLSVIPSAAVFDRRLSHADVRVLSALGTYANKDGRCWPAASTLASRTGMSERHVRTCLRNLERSDYVKTERRPGQSSVYQIPRNSTAGVGPNPGTVVPQPRNCGSGDPGTVVPPNDIKNDTNNDYAFDGFWRIYPSRRPHSNPRKPAREKFEAALKRGVSASDIIRGAQNYAVYVEQETTDPRYIAQAVTWLNQERWAEYQEAPEEVRPEVAPL